MRGRLVVWMMALLPLASVGKKSCLELPEIPIKRYVNSGGQTHPLILGTSDRVTHQLATHVFFIFLKEVLGYQDVRIEVVPDWNLTLVFDSLSPLYSKRVPEVPKVYMMNLEVWLPPEFNTVHHLEVNSIKEGGTIAPPGRYAWFIPKSLSKVPTIEKIDDWTIFKNIQTAKVFSLDKKDRKFVLDKAVQSFDSNQHVKATYYCEEPVCSSGVYTPSWCNQNPCALLITEFTKQAFKDYSFIFSASWQVVWKRMTLLKVLCRVNVLPRCTEDEPVVFGSTLWTYSNTICETMFVVDDIERNKLFVEIVWVGPNLENVAAELESRYLNEKARSLVYLTKMPSPIALKEDHISVNFPPCDEYSGVTPSFNCHYSNVRLVKLAWSRLTQAAKQAFEAFQKIEFTTADYKEMVLEYLGKPPGEDSLKEVACNWMRRHNDSAHLFDPDSANSWRKWEPSDPERNELYIGGIFPLSTMKTNSFTARGIVVSSLMAIEAVNKNNNILRDYNLKLLLDDGKCLADEVMRIFIEYIKLQLYNKLVGILGPACSDTVEPLAGVSKHFKTMVISYSAEGSSFSRLKYPYFFRTIGENKQYKYVYLGLLKQLDWKRVASLTEDGTKYTEYISHTQDLLETNGITFVANRKFPQDWEKDAMKQYLEELKQKNARIIIADVNDEAARAVMCEAYQLKMTAHTGWVWFLPHWLSNNWFNSSIGRDKMRCSTEEMKKAINGHFALTHSYFAKDDEIMQENITVGEWRKHYREKLIDTRKKSLGSQAVPNFLSEESNYAGYAYDAVWVYAYALDKLMKINESYIQSIHDDNATKNFVNLIQNTNFQGVSGQIQFSTGSSRLSNINIMQWIDGQMHVVGTFYPNRTKLQQEYATGSLSMNLNQIKWLNEGGTKPYDGTPEKEICIVQSFADFLNSSCQTAIIVANVTGSLFLLFLLVSAFLFVKHKYDQKVKMTEKYMKHLGIDLLSPSTITNLDKWEIPKDRIVINRKLGEGAFGFVYGGEAYFDQKGWVAVAVKTLKAGSSTEEKLDFLSEAEVMKRFDHKNIVQLLGVCTKNPKEPLLTVMEFMLYGDLKTFLLARRHLVNEKYPDESDEISSKKLTNMALDVARALSYLAELKYVHRDVASRNCLVNVNKVVKLGDFGMTRPTCDNDYYRFNRKGMLPVRWMAPESLVLGVFTPASDVWSYGVLLYEIITFGSFPFQGMSNNQVLEYVKAGNTLNIPTGVKPQLECLIKSCWNKEYKKRPPASEIVEYVANNPRLLSPCIDVPLSSVQMEDTGEISLTGDRGRKFSAKGLRQRSLSHDIDEPLLPSPGKFKQTRGSSLGEEPQDSEL